MIEPQASDPQGAVEAVVRSSYDRLVAYLARWSGDLAGAEDAVSEALTVALERWPDSGVPDRPDTWILTTAKRRMIGAERRRRTAWSALPSLARERATRAERSPDHDLDGPIPDDRLELLYTCAHPAIDDRLHAPLMLQAVLRLDAARIGSAFLVAPTTMGQRLSRAKAKLRDAGVAFRVPGPAELPSRTRSVLDAIYAAYGTGWDDIAGADHKRRGLTVEAERLARLVVELQPDDAESRGLLALILHTDARSAARRDGDGAYVPLEEQQVGRWSRDRIAEAEHHLATAERLAVLGPYQLHAAIQSVHNQRAMTGATDWTAIARLYDGLVALAPGIGSRVARAAAHTRAQGAPAGLALLDELDAATVASYQPYWATRAFVLSQIGRPDEAREAARRAIGLTTEPAVRDHLTRLHLS